MPNEPWTPALAEEARQTVATGNFMVLGHNEEHVLKLLSAALAEIARQAEEMTAVCGEVIRDAEDERTREIVEWLNRNRPIGKTFPAWQIASDIQKAFPPHQPGEPEENP